MTLAELSTKSDVVLVGRVRRVVFVGVAAQGLRDLPEDPKSHVDASPEAEVEVIEVLRNMKHLRLPKMIRYALPNTATSAAEKRLKYDGKEFIFFGEARQLKRADAVLWQMAFPTPDGADPLPIQKLPEVRKILGDKPKARP